MKNLLKREAVAINDENIAHHEFVEQLMNRRVALGLFSTLSSVGLLTATNAFAQKVGDNKLGLYNVTEFGAMPNIQRDNTDMVQAAIDAAGDAGGGIVFFPPGKYWLQHGLRMREYVGLMGSGASATSLIPEISGGEDALSWASATQYGWGGFMRDLTVRLNSGRDIVSLVRWGDFAMDNVALYGAGVSCRYGLHLVDGINTHFRNVRITNAGLAGIWVGANTSVHTSTSFTNCYIQVTHNGPGADVAGIGISFDSCIFESNGPEDPEQGDGLRVRSGSVSVVAPYFENNAGHDLHLGTDNDTSISVLGGLYIPGPWKRPDSIGIYLKKVKGGVIQGGALRLLAHPLVFTDAGSGVTVTGIDVIQEPKYIQNGEEHDVRDYPGFISFQSPTTGGFQQSGKHTIRISGGNLISSHFSGSIKISRLEVTKQNYALVDINVPGALDGDLILLRTTGGGGIPHQLAMKARIKVPYIVEVCIYHIPQSEFDVMLWMDFTIHAEVFRISPLE